jgi:hypothetical protein
MSGSVTWSASWSISDAWSAPHPLKFHLLVSRQFVLEPDSQLHVQPLDLAFVVQHFVELRQGLLLVDGVLFHRRMQRFHRVLQLPLQFIEARGCLVDLGAHESLLLVSQGQLALMLHDHFRRKHRVTQRIARQTRLLRLVRLLTRLVRLLWRPRLC